MSKGLGVLQRRILDCLVNPPAQPQVGLLDHHRLEVEKGVYDLRVVARYVSGGDAAKLDIKEFECVTGIMRMAQWRQSFLYPEASFSVAFGRAVRALIRRGELEQVHRLHRGKLIQQIRFVRLHPKT